MLESAWLAESSGVAMGWAGRMDRMDKVRGTPEFQAKLKKNNFPVTVKIRTSRHQRLVCFIATLPT